MEAKARDGPAGTENLVSGEVHGPIVQVGSVAGGVQVGSAAPVPRELPLDVLGFAGRDAELGELDRLHALAAGQTVVISAVDGMAGVGKTALAVHAAHGLVDRYPGGQLFVDLHGHTPDVPPVEPAAALDQMLRSLGVPGERVPAAVEERSALLRTRLAGRRVLVVLDNAATDAQVRPLLPGTPGCLVLVTSRARLTGLDDAVPLSLDVLPARDAVALFTQAVGEHRVTDPELGREIVELCGRLPLAIRVAAARLCHRPTWSARYLAELLRDERDRLSELEAGHLSVKAALGVSYTQLTAGQQRMFRLLSLHPGADIEPYAAAALTRVTVPAARRTLEQLLDVHLLVQRVPGRYAFHNLVRAYATERTHASDAEADRDAALARLRDHYAHTTTAAMDVLYPHNVDQRRRPPAPDTPVPGLGDLPAAAAWLDAELPNVLATVRTADRGSPDYTMSATLHRHLRGRAWHNDAETLHQSALTLARETGDPTGELSALIGLGEVNFMKARYEQAVGFLGQALRIARETGDATGALNALNARGRVLALQSRYGPAEDSFTDALDIAAEIGDRYGENYALNGLGYSRMYQGHHEQAASWFRQTLENAREIGDHSGEVNALTGLGFNHMRQGRHRDAASCFEQVLAGARETGDHAGEILTLNGFGFSHLQQGHYERAASCFRRALESARETGDRNGDLNALDGLGRIFLAQGRFDRAADCFAQALEIAEDAGSRYGEIHALGGLGHLHLGQGRNEEAAGCFERAFEIAQEVGVRYFQFQVHHGLGQLHDATGDHDRALTHQRVAVDLATEVGHPQERARAHDALARTCHAVGRPEQARRHWRAALDILSAQDSDHTEDPQVNAATLRAHLGA